MAAVAAEEMVVAALQRDAVDRERGRLPAEERRSLEHLRVVSPQSEFVCGRESGCAAADDTYSHDSPFAVDSARFCSRSPSGMLRSAR